MNLISKLVLASFLLCGLASTEVAGQSLTSTPVGSDSATAGVTQWREAFRNAHSKEGLKIFRELMRKSEDSTSAAFGGFQATSEMMSAEYLVSPFAKLRRFRKWSRALDSEIRLNPDDPDIRLLRLLIQTNAPRFLGYSESITGDCKIVSTALDSGYWDADKKHERFTRESITPIGECL